jgi:hypothetical protein
VARGVTEDHLGVLGATWVTPPDVAKLIADADKTVTF